MLTVCSDRNRRQLYQCRVRSSYSYIIPQHLCSLRIMFFQHLSDQHASGWSSGILSAGCESRRKRSSPCFKNKPGDNASYKKPAHCCAGFQNTSHARQIVPPASKQHQRGAFRLPRLSPRISKAKRSRTALTSFGSSSS